MDLRSRRKEIFQQVQDGLISVEEAARLLADMDNMPNPEDRAEEDAVVERVSTSLEGSTVSTVVRANLLAAAGELPAEPAEEESEPEPVVRVPEAPDAFSDDQESAGGHWWLLVFIPGLLLLLAAANWMVEGYLAARLGWGFWLSFIPFGLGLLLTWFGWEIRMARWLSLHIRQKPGSHPREIYIKMPLPTGLIRWGLQRFGKFSMPASGKDIGDFIGELDQAVAADGPMHLLVDDPDGDRVEIKIDGPRRR